MFRAIRGGSRAPPLPRYRSELPSFMRPEQARGIRQSSVVGPIVPPPVIGVDLAAFGRCALDVGGVAAAARENLDHDLAAGRSAARAGTVAATRGWAGLRKNILDLLARYFELLRLFVRNIVEFAVHSA